MINDFFASKIYFFDRIKMSVLPVVFHARYISGAGNQKNIEHFIFCTIKIIMVAGVLGSAFEKSFHTGQKISKNKKFKSILRLEKLFFMF